MAAEDEMDSLFEGMVLFDPSQITTASAEVYDDNQRHQHQQNQLPQASEPSSTYAGVSQSQQPLDENLFSDLTLITPQSDTSTVAPSSAATTAFTTPTSTSGVTDREASHPLPSRQISTTRKKRRAGLRIGYGRDSDQSQLVESEPSRFSLSRSSSSLSSEITVNDRAGEAEVEEDEQMISSHLQPKPDLDVSDAITPVDNNTTGVDNSGLPDEIREEVIDSNVSDAITTVDNTPAVDNSCSSDMFCEGVDDSSDTTRKLDLSNEEDTRLEDNGQLLSSDNSSSSIELRFEQIRAEVCEKIKRARESVASVSAARKDATKSRRKAAENVSLASTKFIELEKELEDACEAEDFEKADKISEILQFAEKEKELLAVALRDADAECDAIDSQMQEALHRQIAAEEECVYLLNNFAADAANDADLVTKSAQELSSKEIGDWLTTTEATEVKKMELEIQSHLINELRLVLSDCIEHSVEDDRKEREFLCQRKEILTDELEKLLALVKDKEAEITENNSKIEKVEKRIAKAVSGFQEARTRVEEKYDNVQSSLHQVELEHEVLSRGKKEIDDYFSMEEDRVAKIRELSRISVDEAHAYREAFELRKSLVQFVLKSWEDKVKLAKMEEKLSEVVQMLKQEVFAARASLQELSSRKSVIQQEVESLKQRIFFIDKRIPELEAEKKVAATARNFKEAARIAADAKTLIVEKEDMQIKLDGAVLELGKCEEDISGTFNGLQETEDQISSQEKELALARFQRLLLIAGAARAERSAALELGDHQEADILLAEAEAADSEARELQSTCDLKGEEPMEEEKHFISMDLVSSLGGKQLAELAASARISAL